MSQTFSYSAYLESETCCSCGIAFGMPTDFKSIAQRKAEGKTFYCPNGHPQHYTSESDDAKIKRLTRERDEARARTERERQSKLKLEKRISRGVCPCCHRSFSQIARHMKTKHPDFPVKGPTA